MNHPSVLHLIRPQPPGEVGGADLHVVDLAVEQLANGLEVVVGYYGNPEYGQLLHRRGIPGIGVDTGGLRAWWRAMRDHLAASRVTILHSHGYESDYVATALHLASRGRPEDKPAFVITSHGFIRTGIRLRTMTLLNERCLSRADAIITASPLEERRLRGLGHREVHYVANGVAPADGAASRSYVGDQLGLPDDGPRVAYVGRLSPEKRPDLFLDMARQVAAERDDVTFAVVGSGPLAGDTRAAAEHMGLGGRIRFAGLRRDVGALLAGVDILVCCSDTEGTPRAVIEAMLAGVPVVGTGVGGLPDLVVDEVTGLLVEAGSADGLAQAVRRVLEDPEGMRAMGDRGRIRAESLFSAARMQTDVGGVYARVSRWQSVSP